MQTNKARTQHTTVRCAWRFSQWCTKNSVLKFFLDNLTPKDEDTTLPGNVRSDNQLTQLYLRTVESSKDN